VPENLGLKVLAASLYSTNIIFNSKKNNFKEIIPLSFSNKYFFVLK